MDDILLWATMLVCLYTDLREKKIYNKVLVPSFLLGVLINLVYNGWTGLLLSGKGFFLGLGLLFLPFLVGGIGAGDIKFLAVIGAIKGPGFVFSVFLGMGLAGGCIALAILLRQKRLGAVLDNLGKGVVILFTSRFRVVAFGDGSEQNLFPYGVAIGIGVLVSYVIQVI